jgi:hypothetical protein
MAIGRKGTNPKLCLNVDLPILVVDNTLDASSSDHIYVLIMLTPYTVLERFDRAYVGLNLQPADLTSKHDKHPDEHLIKARWFLSPVRHTGSQATP